MFLASQADAHSLPLVVLALTLTGLGISPSFPAMMVASQNGAELRDLGIVTSMIAFFRTLGGSFGAAILWSVLIGTLGASLAAANAGALSDIFLGGGPGAVSHLPEGSRAVLMPALAHSYRIVFLLAAGICVAALIAVTFLREKPLRDQPAYSLREHTAE